jgi:cytochrome c oxidase cbb3-type subunit 3
MSEKKQDEIREHQFDGIQEYDNRLPRWWIGSFIITILVGLYLWGARYNFGWDPTLKEGYEKDMADLKALQDAKGSAGPTDEEVLAWVKDPHELAEGKRIFSINCIACHGAYGQGVIGPNLTDDYWLHGGKPSQIAHTIQTGVPEKGMPTWKGVLSPSDIRHAAAYVVSIHGSHPANPKAPQGVKE